MEIVSFGSVVHSAADGLGSLFRRALVRLFGGSAFAGDNFAQRPLIVRRGIVAKRRDLTQTVYIGSARFGTPNPQVALLLFHIDCDDELGSEQLIVLIEKDSENRCVDVGNAVVVESRKSRFDSSYAYRSIRLSA